jgi:putative ABC transport system permease protein
MLGSPALFLTRLAQDARYAIRMLRKSPAFTTVAIVTLAVGTGATAALFSVVDSVLLRPLPYPDADRLVTVWERPPQGDRNVVSTANFLDWRDQNRVFDHLVATTFRSFEVSGKDAPDMVFGMLASPPFFEMLGVKPRLGRTFTNEDDRHGAPKVAVLSYASWQRRFGGEPGIIGRTITVDRTLCSIIGVMPPGFRFVGDPEMWVPIALDPATATRDFHWLVGLGRLRSDVTFLQAKAAMESIAANIARAYPKSNKGWSVRLIPFQEALIEDQERGVLVLFGAIGFVLLIGCVNIANLLLAKGAARRRELAVRASVGAGSGRLLAQMLTESVLLGAIGGALGCALAFWLVRLSHLVVARSLLAGVAEISVNGRVLLFTAALSALTGVLFGLLPAWRASKVAPHSELKQASRGSAGGGGHRLRSALVVAEVALSLVLLAGAGLMVRSLIAIQNADHGFRPENVLTAQMTLARERYPGAVEVRAFDRRLLGALRALPGVRAAAVSTNVPLAGNSWGMPFHVASRPQPPISEWPGAPFQMVSDGYFETMRIPLRKGRLFTERDSENGPRVAIVNEAFVKRYVADKEPLGERLIIEEIVTGKTELGKPVPWEIVGVVADAGLGGLRGDHVPVIYVPHMQSPTQGRSVSLRTALDPARMTEALRRTVRNIDKDLPLTNVRTMEEVASESASRPRRQAWMIGVFAAVALILAAFGVYGVLSYSVAQRTNEMGIRMALGAQPRELLRMTMRHGMALAVIGLAIGLAAAFALTRVMASLLYEVKPADPFTYAAVSMLLLGVAAAATYAPARRAGKVDPITALRWE